MVIGSAFGSFYFSQNLNQASVPNAPESEPQAAYTSKKTESWNGGEACKQGCGANEYCENGRCRKSGGSGDARNPEQVAAGAGTKLVSPTTVKFDPNNYVCTPQNCPSPDFFCKNGNTCVNAKNQNLSVANDSMNCGGTGKKCLSGETCIMGNCEKLDQYDCDKSCLLPYVCKLASDGVEHCVDPNIVASKITPYVTVAASGLTPMPTPTNLPAGTKVGDPNNCNGVVCVSGLQYCDITSSAGTCKGIPGKGVDICNGIAPDLTGKQSCCIPGDIEVGLISEESFKNITNPVDSNRKVGDLDNRIHWTNCAAGTTCRQGVGCIGTATKTPGTTTTTTTTTVTVPPTITTTTTPSVTTTTTVTVPPTNTITVTPTPVSCNESCAQDSDCVSGLYCDATAKKCRKSECSTETSCVCPTGTPEPTIVGCNKGCESDSNCMDGLVCDSNSGRCRRPSCMSSSDCRCQREITTTRRPTERETIAATRRPTTRQQETLTEAGILDLPGAITFGGGLILAIVGILLAL